MSIAYRFCAWVFVVLAAGWALEGKPVWTCVGWLGAIYFRMAARDEIGGKEQPK